MQDVEQVVREAAVRSVDVIVPGRSEPEREHVAWDVGSPGAGEPQVGVGGQRACASGGNEPEGGSLVLGFYDACRRAVLRERVDDEIVGARTVLAWRDCQRKGQHLAE